MQELPHADPSWPGALTTQSNRQVCFFSARSVGKSTLVRQWLKLMAARHIGDQSKLVAKSVLPHSSTTTLLEACTSQEVLIQDSLKHFRLPCFSGSMQGTLNGMIRPQARK